MKKTWNIILETEEKRTKYFGQASSEISNTSE